MKIIKRAILIAMLSSGVCAKIVSAQTLPVLPENQLVLPPKSFEIKFEWHGDSIQSQWEPYAALLLPVKLPNCPRQFFMQFDLGSPYSLFYRDKLEEIQSKYPRAAQLTDSAKAIKNYRFKVGEMPVTAKEIVIKQFDSAPKNGAEHNEMDIIGTIGSDFIDDRVVMIDYPQQKIVNGIAPPANLRMAPQLFDFVYTGRRILLPAIIKGKNTVLFFDTGSSAFELLTDKETFDLLASPKAIPIQYPVKSWNKVFTAHSIATTDSLEMALRNIPLNKVTYIEGASSAQIEQMMKIGIGGMTGNKLFLNYRLLLDTKNKKFGILGSSGKIKEDKKQCLIQQQL